MSAQRNQTSSTTYRNRRIIALVVLAVVVTIVWNVVAGIVGFFAGVFGGGEAKSNTSASAPATPGAVGDCAPGTVIVQANVGIDSTPSTVFAANVKPSFWFTVTNTGTETCNFNAGTKVSFLTVTSGEEVIWDNEDCKTRATSDTDYILALEPGVPMAANPSTWERVRSSSTGCDATTEQAVTGGGASYHLVATVNGVKSESVQFILN
jgi:hypothetical protein